jgi:hypothetical protein
LKYFAIFPAFVTKAAHTWYSTTKERPSQNFSLPRQGLKTNPFTRYLISTWPDTKAKWQKDNFETWIFFSE